VGCCAKAWVGLGGCSACVREVNVKHCCSRRLGNLATNAEKRKLKQLRVFCLRSGFGGVATSLAHAYRAKVFMECGKDACKASVRIQRENTHTDSSKENHRGMKASGRKIKGSTVESHCVWAFDLRVVRHVHWATVCLLLALRLVTLWPSMVISHQNLDLRSFKFQSGFGALCVYLCQKKGSVCMCFCLGLGWVLF